MEYAAAGMAKVTRPRLYRTLQRERLFRRLDDMHERKAIWITGPPGAGKTTLVSSYLECRQVPALWYQMDNGDSDPASFFYYLAIAFNALGSGEQLPLLTPEYLPDLSGFTRRFFRQLYSGLQKASVLVFDNYHVVPQASVLHLIIRDALEEVPDSICVIVTSRTEPPATLTRLRLSHALANIDANELQVSLAEARQIAVLGEPSVSVKEDEVRALWETSGGWAVGFVLMLEHRRATGGQSRATTPASRELLFNYFAVEIFGAASPDVRHLLLRTAFLPLFTVPMAEAISGDLEAGKRLNELYRLRYFIDRRDEPEVTYEYHVLFREFLLARAREHLESAEYALLQRRSARLLENRNHPELAFSLYVCSEDWTAAVRLIRQEAPDLIRQGRWRTAKSWIEMLPPELLESDPWLPYWGGACDVAIDPEHARAALEKAYAGLAAQHDVPGQVMAASLIMKTYYFEWTKFEPLDRWINVLSHLLDGGVLFSSATDELRARSGLVAALLHRQPQHPLLRPESARALALLEADVSTDDRFTAGIILLNCYCFRGDFDCAERVVGLLQPHLADKELTPLNQVWWQIAVAYYQLLRAHHDAAADALDRSDAIAHQHGLSFIRPAVLTQRVFLALSFGDLECAGALLPMLEAVINPARHMDLALFHSAQSWYEFQRGDLAAAMKHAQTAVDGAFQAGAVTIQTYCLLGRVQVLLEFGECAHALASVHKLRLRAGGASRLLEFSTLLVEAFAALRTGDTAGGLALLRTGLTIGREENYLNTLRWHPKMVVRLLCHALEEGIEVEYVKHLIRARRLFPDTPEIEQWPWPIKLYLLGRFSVVIDHKPHKTSGKAQAKPLELLKALVAYGGREVASATLAAQIWPDLEGDAAQSALDTTLHRLRKLLQQDDAVIVQQAKLSLNPAKVWVDVWAFERLSNRLEHEVEVHVEGAAKFFRLYLGDFLQQDTDTPWLLPLRERLRSKFLRQVLKLGGVWENVGDWNRAADAYRHGIEVDNLSEELYRKLMFCEYKQGHSAAALEAYRRCRHMLSIVLGVKPSAETEAAYHTIMNQMV
jgi:ATP/maltotriose-dependent transcriptional regulator MalT/DNA-binding SARP family transcriptional activator